jgi:hypothetical protein
VRLGLVRVYFNAFGTQLDLTRSIYKKKINQNTEEIKAFLTGLTGLSGLIKLGYPVD